MLAINESLSNDDASYFLSIDNTNARACMIGNSRGFSLTYKNGKRISLYEGARKRRL